MPSVSRALQTTCVQCWSHTAYLREGGRGREGEGGESAEGCLYRSSGQMSDSELAGCELKYWAKRCIHGLFYVYICSLIGWNPCI